MRIMVMMKIMKMVMREMRCGEIGNTNVKANHEIAAKS